MDNDADRYRRFLNGDDNGLREIIDKYYNGLMLYINGIVNNIAEAEDIVQDTFVKLAIKRPIFNGKSEFKTWLYVIAKNCAYNYLKRYKKRISDYSIDDYVDLCDERDLEKDHLISERNILLYKTLRELRPEYFQVLYLFYFEDLITDDIAKVMHKSKRQIGDLLYRAKKSLKTKLEKVGFQYEKF